MSEKRLYFQPKDPNGVLFDADGRVSYRFAGYDTGRWYPIGEMFGVDPSRGVEYADTTRPGEELSRPIEADPNSRELPNPAQPSSYPDPMPEGFRYE